MPHIIIQMVFLLPFQMGYDTTILGWLVVFPSLPERNPSWRRLLEGVETTTSLDCLFWMPKHMSKSKYTSRSDDFWKFICRKSVRGCGAKHISKVNMLKTSHVRTTFGGWDVEQVHAVVVRSTFWRQKVANTQRSDHSWTLVIFPGRCTGFCALPEVSQTCG